jgi:DNA-binding SARP family transcriptional activator
MPATELEPTVSMEFRVLGPIEACVDGQVVDLGRPQQRLVLAVLLAEVARPVSTEMLIDRVWDDAPGGARRALHVHMARLRRLFAQAGDAARVPAALVRRSGGYVLDADPDSVDMHRFQRLVNEARRQDCSEPERRALLEQALDLWYGSPLADLPGRWAARVRQGWRQQYLETMMAWAQASLRMGDPGRVLRRLTELVAEHPLVESLAAVHMHALYVAGRTAEALDHYHVLRRRLADELGIDPRPGLQQLHHQILTSDPALDPPTTTIASPHRPLPRDGHQRRRRSSPATGPPGG